MSLQLDLPHVVVGLSILYFAPSGTAFPPDSLQPADWTKVQSVDDLPDWPAPWKPIGATDQGVTISANPKTSDIQVEEQSTPVRVTEDSKDVLVDAVMAEDTLEHMQLSYGSGDITTVASGVGQPAKKVYTFSDVIKNYAVGVETLTGVQTGTGPNLAVNGYWRRYSVPGVISASSKVDTSFRRSKTPRLHAVQFRAICAIKNINWAEMTAVGS